MERTFSVDDLVGGIWRLNQSGMGRTDSEAAFQEFLKRIPSSTNLAAAASQLDQSSTAQLQQQVQQLQQQQHASTSSAPILPTASMADIAGLAGIPRVPSLDFLRQLSAISSQQAYIAPPVKLEAPTPPPGHLGLAALSAADLAQLSASGGLGAALQAVPALAGTNPLAAAAALQNHAAAALQNQAAAALQNQAALGQLAQLNQLSQLTNRLQPAAPVPVATTSQSSEPTEKSEIRRARRMLSNRESARRSRRRKQEHLTKLEQEINAVDGERKTLADKVAVLERKCASVDDENRRLREENDRLRDELRFLRTEITERKERNGYYSRRDFSDDEHRSANGKRHKSDHRYHDRKDNSMHLHNTHPDSTESGSSSPEHTSK